MCFSLKFFSLKSLTVCSKSTIFYVWIEMWSALFLKFVISKGMDVTLKFHISFFCWLQSCLLCTHNSFSFFLFLFHLVPLFFSFSFLFISTSHCSLWQYLLLDLCCGGCHMHFIICRSHIWILDRKMTVLIYIACGSYFLPVDVWVIT